jgi:hypothetical protein
MGKRTGHYFDEMNPQVWMSFSSLKNNKTIIEFGFRRMENYQALTWCYQPQLLIHNLRTITYISCSCNLIQQYRIQYHRSINWLLFSLVVFNFYKRVVHCHTLCFTYQFKSILKVLSGLVNSRAGTSLHATRVSKYLVTLSSYQLRSSCIDWSHMHLYFTDQVSFISRLWKCLVDFCTGKDI